MPAKLRQLFVTTLIIGLALALPGCPKKVPQPEIDAAEKALADLDQTKDCAPETYQAARTTMERAQALLKEERYEEAKAALIAAKKLAEKAREECEKKRKQEAEEEAARKRQAEIDAENAARAAQAAVDPPKGPTEMKTVHFGFNNSDLTDEAREILGANAEYIRNRPGIRVQIEGHCDSRGSTEYNLSLGERRALSVRQYLSKTGLDPNQLEIISYGEERLLDDAESDEAHAQNRRAEFRALK